MECVALQVLTVIPDFGISRISICMFGFLLHFDVVGLEWGSVSSVRLYIAESKNSFLQACRRATLLFCMTLDRATKHRHLQ